MCRLYFNLIEESDSIFVNDDSLNTLSYYFGNNTWKEEYFLKIIHVRPTFTTKKEASIITDYI